MVDHLSYSIPSIRIPPPSPRDSHSPLRSPKRKLLIPTDEDPLLGKLSPEAILDALSAINAVSKHERQAKDLLVRSISQVSNNERALGARAAVAAQKLRQWLKEIQGWQWPSGKEAQAGRGFVSPTSSRERRTPTNTSEAPDREVYCGSLTLETVVRYGARIEEIRDGMDSLNVEELKEHVLNVHIPARSRPSSANSAFSSISVAPPFSYVQLSDFNAVITATILRALPTMARLNILLNTWDVRLLVLRQIPGFLMAVKSARAALDSALSSLQNRAEVEDLSVDAFFSKKNQLGQSIAAAGSNMDNILDALEGREDTLPEWWVDDLDRIEADFVTWAVEAERRAVENNWKRSKMEAGREVKSVPVESQPLDDDRKVESKAAADLGKGQSDEHLIQDGSSQETETSLCGADQGEIVGQGTSAATEKRNADVTEVEPTNALSSEDDKRHPASIEDSPATAKSSTTITTEEAVSAMVEQQPSHASLHDENHTTYSTAKTSTNLDKDVTPDVNDADSNPSISVGHVSIENNSSFSEGCSKPDAEDTSLVNTTVDLPTQQHANDNELSTFQPQSDSNPQTNIISIAGPREQSNNESHRQTDENSMTIETASTTTVTAPPGLDGAADETSPVIHVDATKDDKLPVQHYGKDPAPDPNAGTMQPKPSEDVMRPIQSEEKLENAESDQTANSQAVPTINPATSSEATPSKATSHPGDEEVPHELSTDVLIEQESTTDLKPEEVLQTSNEVSNQAMIDQELQDITVQIPGLGPPINTSTPRASLEETSNPVEALTTGYSATTQYLHGHSPDSAAIADPSSETPNLLLHSKPAISNWEAELDLDQDQPIQSIEFPELHENAHTSLKEEAAGQVSMHRLSSVERATPDLTIPSSPGLVSPDSDRTLRETSSAQLDHEILQRLQSFRHEETTSLPMQRFINDETEVSYGIHDGFQRDLFSTPRRGSDIPSHLRGKSDITLSHKDSESPPLDIIPRRAVKQPSSTLMRGTISSLNKAVPSARRQYSNIVSPDIPIGDPSARYKLAPSVDLDSRSRSLNMRSSIGSTLGTPTSRLNSQPSMDSLSSFISNSEAGETGRRYSFSTEGESFAMRPLIEPDNDLQEKINSILTGIPGRIHLSSTPAYDFDQRSTLSGISTSKRERLGSRSPFSTPSRSSTPTPSLNLTPAVSRPRRKRAHRNDDNSVRVYHLHHRGKTAPTKLFVRTVGENGERVMVRVGGGWADLGEYLREYVLHHGRHTGSSGPIEVQGLPAPGSSAAYSPGSTLVPSIEHERPASVISNRPMSSLSVRKTRRTSKPAELPKLTAENIEMVTENIPPAPASSRRRPSVSSITSVSMSSILGDGSGVYSPHPGSARMPPSHSTPLGLAGPKPRTRHVSMTPESEAWVEDVIGQARRTSSSTTKPATQKHADPRMDRELHNSSRMSLRSVSDIGTAGLNKRVLLKGLGGKTEQPE
jgi:hypothetical protein